jgi:myosin heavy subunit
MTETPSSTVENIPQSEGDFASWLSDRLDKFQKGEETAPWDKKEETSETDVKPAADEAAPEVKEEEPQTEEGEEEVKKDVEEAAEEKEASTDEEAKNMSPSAGAKFKELKNELKAYKAKVAEMEKAISEKSATPENSSEVEELRSRLAEYEREIAVTRVEATPEYRQAILEPTQSILDAASTLAERYKVDARQLVNALREEGLSAEGSDALTEIAGDFAERDRVRLYRMADDLAEVGRRREFLKENAQRALAEREAQQKTAEAEYERQYREESKAAAEKAWSELNGSENFSKILQSLGEPVINEVKSSVDGTDIIDAPPDTRAYALYAGMLLPHVVKQVQASQAKVVELEKALSKYKKATPKVGGNTDTTTPSTLSEGNFLDAVEKRFSNG